MLLGAALWSQQSSAESLDESFQQSHGLFLAWHDPDWKWLKAQGIAESNLVATAVSPAGAVGIMQFMPAAWAECMQALGVRSGSRTNPRLSVLCGGWYMRKMLRFWSDPRTTLERWQWAWASYNWGAGNVLKTQRGCLDTTRYFIIEPHLPRETRDYVRRIERIHNG